MQPYISEQIHPGIITIQALLRKIDRLRLPLASRRDVESILVRQVAKEIDRALPWQAGHGCRTAAISLLIGQAVGLTPGELHNLKLASFLHDIGLLMLPHDLTTGVNRPDSESYVTVQNHPRLGDLLLGPFFFLREASVLVAHHHERWDGRAIPTESEAPSSLLDRGFWPSPTHMTRSKYQTQIMFSETRSRSEFSGSHQGHNSIRLWSKSSIGLRISYQRAMARNSSLGKNTIHRNRNRRHHDVCSIYLA
jgi:HD domain